MSGCDKAICLFSLLFLIQIRVWEISERERKRERASASVQCPQCSGLSAVIYLANRALCGSATADQPSAHCRVKGERLIQWRTSRLLLLESRLVLKLRAAGGWKCRKIILSLPMCSSWVRGAFMTTDFIFIFSYLHSSRKIDSEGFRPMVEKGRAEMEDHRTYFHSHCPSVIKCLDWDQQNASTDTQK